MPCCFHMKSCLDTGLPNPAYPKFCCCLRMKVPNMSYLLQGPEHPNPGMPYTARGFPRYCYLPDNEKGRKVWYCVMGFPTGAPDKWQGGIHWCWKGPCFLGLLLQQGFKLLSFWQAAFMALAAEGQFSLLFFLFPSHLSPPRSWSS